MTPFDLTGRVAIVTGGNRGIGLAIARGLAEAGAAVVIAARDRARLAQAKDELLKSGRDITAIELDVADPDSIRRMTSTALATFGRIDVLVANAGTNIRKAPEAYTLEEWNVVLDVNLRAPFLCAQAVLPAMQAAGRGKIINIGSMTSIFGASFAAPYSASKGGIVQLTKALATAWARHDIQVNALLPGWIDTELTERSRAEIVGLEQRVTERTPAGRWGKPEDLAGAAVFLASRASDFITGAAIPVDGGYSSQA
jgi:2-deoxy-D-gluconate 3-dehydrogenase